MPDDFPFDVFLSHSAKDKAIVRDIATRLTKDGVRVWFDEEQIKPGDHVQAKVEEGLENSRVLLFCMSAHSMVSDWAQLEYQSFRFRDPLNKERRFLPLRLDKAPIKSTLAPFLHIDWNQENREKAYAELFDTCRPPSKFLQSSLDLLSPSYLTDAQDHSDDKKGFLLVVDDDLNPESFFIKVLKSAFAAKIEIETATEPDEAIRILKNDRKILGCITDIVFRNHSVIGGVQVAEAAIQRGVPIIVVTGHKLQHIGLALEEFTRIGLQKTEILKKPTTRKDLERFLSRIKTLFLTN